MSSLAGTYSITIEKGATYDQVFTWKDSDGVPVDLSGYSASLQIRSSSTGYTLLDELTVGNGITLGGDQGTISVLMSATETNALPAGNHSYDLELTSASGYVTRLLKGKFVVLSEVIR